LADVFVSYSRSDSELVNRLVERLRERGKDVWVDVEGIRDAEVFPAALRRAVEGSDGFVFVISPDSVASPFCEQEVDHAVELNKRVVPLSYRFVPDEQIPEGIRVRNWIPVGDGDFDAGVERLVQALDTDLEWDRGHTHWLLKAIEWNESGRDRSFLLRGSELTAAEGWLASGADKDPGPTALQQEYVYASRTAATRRQRTLAGASLVVAAVSVALLVFALISRHDAVNERTTAKSRALAGQSGNQLAVDPELSLLLAREAVRTKPTPDALFALRRALDASPLRLALHSQGRQVCGPDIFGPGLVYAGRDRIVQTLCNGDVFLLNAEAGRIESRRHPANSAPSVELSPDRKQLGVATEDGVVLLDATTGATVRRLRGGGQEHHVTVKRLAFSPDGFRVAAATPEGVMVWTVKGGKGRLLIRGHGSFADLTFTPDGRNLIVGACGCPPDALEGVRIYDASTGRLLRRLPGTRLMQAVELSPDGSRLATADWEQGVGKATVRIWEVPTWRRVRTITPLEGVQLSALAFSPDGSELAIGGTDGTAGMWSLKTGKQTLSFLGHTSAINAIAFRPGGDEVATAASDGTARVWRATGGEQAMVDIGRPEQVILRGDELTTLSVPDFNGPPKPPVLRRWRISDGKLVDSRQLERPRSQLSAMALSSDLASTAEVDRTGIVIRDLPGRKVLGRLHYPRQEFLPMTLAATRDNTRGAVLLGQAARFENPTGLVRDLPDGRARTLQGAPPCGADWRSAAFSRDGKLLAGATFCGDVVIWNATTGKLVDLFSIGGQISQIAFGRGRLLAVGSWDSTVTLWDVAKHRSLRKLTGHVRGISTLAFNPSGTMLATGSADNTVRIWDPTSGRTLRILDLPTYVYAVDFSKDGRLYALDNTGVVSIWNPCPGCNDGDALLAASDKRVTRQLTPLERETFLGGF
jgi:WD40 repeat protein